MHYNVSRVNERNYYLYQQPDRVDVLKLVILDSIKESRAAIRVFNDCVKTFPEMSSEFFALIEYEQGEIRKELQELIQLKKRRARQAIEREKIMREKLNGKTG
jgi:hypothetical protein